MGLYSEIKGKIESLTLVGHLPREISRFCKYFLESTTASLMRQYAQQSSVEVHYHRVAQKHPSSSGLEKKSSFGDIQKDEKFVLDNYLEPEKIPFDVKTEEEEEDEFFENL